MSVRRLTWLLAVLPAACGGSGGGTVADGGGGAGGAASDAGPDTDAVVIGGSDAGPIPDVGTPDPGPLPSLRAVSGDLTFVERYVPGDAKTGHLYSIQTDGALRQRLTQSPGAWAEHAVGPDKRYIAAVRHRTPAGEDEADAPGEVWIVDVKTHHEYALSPVGCDAGGGGVGWRDEVQVMFAMKCGDAVSQVYMASRDDETRALDHRLPAFQADADEAIRDVFPAVGTSVFAYTVDHPICAAGDCFLKPQVWIADQDSGDHCQVTDGDLAFDDLGTVTDAEKRLGDHDPAFSVDLTSLTFSRNVGGKPAGPTGHHDPFRIGVDLVSLYAGRRTCDLAGTKANLAGALVTDDYPLPGGGSAPGSERYPQSATAGGELSGMVLFVARVDSAPTPTAAVYVVDRSGNRTLLSNPAAEAVAARWITSQFDTSGVR